MSATERDQLALHVVFAAVASLCLLVLRGDGPTGPWVLGLVLGYHLATVVVTRWRGHDRWRRTWAFAAVLSMWMVLPDAVLASGIGVLEFPPDGVPSLGPVTLPMAAMWAVPAVVIVAVADAVTFRRGTGAGWAAAVVTAGVIFAGAEATLTRLPIWRAVDVTTVAEVAVYIVPAELFLGAAIVAAERWCRRGPGWHRVPVAGVVALSYTGAAVSSWLIVERGLLA